MNFFSIGCDCCPKPCNPACVTIKNNDGGQFYCSTLRVTSPSSVVVYECTGDPYTTTCYFACFNVDETGEYTVLAEGHPAPPFDCGGTICSHTFTFTVDDVCNPGNFDFTMCCAGGHISEPTGCWDKNRGDQVIVETSIGTFTFPGSSSCVPGDGTMATGGTMSWTATPVPMFPGHVVDSGEVFVTCAGWSIQPNIGVADGYVCGCTSRPIPKTLHYSDAWGSCVLTWGVLTANGCTWSGTLLADCPARHLTNAYNVSCYASPGPVAYTVCAECDSDGVWRVKKYASACTIFPSDSGATNCFTTASGIGTWDARGATIDITGTLTRDCTWLNQDHDCHSGDFTLTE